jgi:hypothetical protein
MLIHTTRKENSLIHTSKSGMLCMSLVPLIRGMVETDPNLAGDQKAITNFLATLLD